MKSKIFLFVAFILVTAACKKETIITPTLPEPVKEEIKPDEPKTECYLYDSNGNVVSLQVHYNKDKVDGNLTYSLNEKDSNKGTFNGTFENNILLLDYTFQSEGTESTRQLAYKLVDNKLVEGYGEI